MIILSTPDPFCHIKHKTIDCYWIITHMTGHYSNKGFIKKTDVFLAILAYNDDNDSFYCILYFA